MKRFLITTADERSWKSASPVLFLGEWCRCYDRKQIWEEMDAIVAEPYGLQVGQKERDLAFLNIISNQLLDEVANELNKFHKTRHSLRYWNILIGHWLICYVETAFNRYFALEKALKNHDVSKTIVFDSTDYSLTTNDSLDFIYACNDDVWNNIFYSKVIKFWGDVKFEVDSVPLQGVSGFSQERNHLFRPTNGIKYFIFYVVKNIFQKLIRKHDALIVGSYLPIKEEIKLQLSFGQCPQLWQSPSLKKFKPNQEKRQHFSIDSKKHSGFEQFVRDLIVEIIPICYLEGYDQLIQQVKSLPLPAEPKFIFTSNNFDTDQIFKAWTAMKVEEGFSYFTGQHGNNYGTHFYDGSPSRPERSTSDKFFTWGWSNKCSNVVPAFNFKIAGRKSNKFDTQGGLLLVEKLLPHRITPWDSYFEYGIYQEEQFRFVAALPKSVQKRLTVRLHAGYKNQKWFDDQRWKDRYPNIQIETGLTNIRDLISKSRLVVHSYDSTGLLETMALDIPTLCFWYGGLNHLLPSAKPYYELLRGAGILLDSPEEAARMVSLKWDSVFEWWQTQIVQDARKSFCRQYSKMEKYPVKTMKRLLTAHQNQE